MIAAYHHPLSLPLSVSLYHGCLPTFCLASCPIHVPFSLGNPVEELSGGQGQNNHSIPWPLILLEVDIYVGIVHGSMGEKVGR